MSVPLSSRWGVQLLLGWVHLTLAAPSVYLWLGLPLVMRQQGWSATEIGLFQLAGIPAVFKFLLARPIERHGHETGRYRRWSLATLALFAASLLGLSQLSPAASRPVLFLLVFASAVFATWADIPCNALAMRWIKTEERLRAGSIRSAATFAGAISGGGFMLLLQQRFGWAWPFIAMSGALLVSLALLALLRPAEPPSGQRDDSPENPPGWRTNWREFFAQPGGRVWGVLLLGYFPFIAAAWVYLKPLMLDLGFPPAMVATVVGIGGATLGTAASMATAAAPRRRLPALLRLSAFANAAALFLLAFSVTAGQALWVVVSGAAVAIAMGTASALAFTLMMHFSRQRSPAGDYGLQSSLFTGGRLAIMPLAGLLLDRLGYGPALCFLGAGAALLALYLARQRHFPD